MTASLPDPLSLSVSDGTVCSAHQIQRLAHRAGNTRKTLGAALAAGVDWLEIDLWYSYGRLVARHDRSLWRLPIVVDKWHVHTDFRPLELAEILQLTVDGPRLFLDFKGKHPGMPAAVLDVLQTHKAIGRTAVCGQFWRPLDALARLEPQLDLYYSIGHRKHVAALARRREAGLRARGVSIHRKLVTPAVVDALHRDAFEVFSWIVNEPAQAEQLVASGVDGVISDSLRLLGGLP